MSLYLDNTGGIGICGRCSLKFPLAELRPDVNFPGLMVCSDDADEIDPYRLPARQPENITLRYPRPDVPLTTTTVAPGDPSWPISS